MAELHLTRARVLRWSLTVVLVAAGILVASLPTIIRSWRVRPPLAGRITFTDSVPAAPGVEPADSAAVMAALGRVVDPELGFNLSDLGLVHRLAVDRQGNVTLLLALTTPECPYVAPLADQVIAGLKSVPGVHRISITLDPAIAWDPARLSGEARARWEKLFKHGTGAGR